MRNWNKFLIPKKAEPTAPLRAYLWGIETYSPSYKFECGLCCEPTYEELKLLKIAPKRKTAATLRAYLWGIETIVCFCSKNKQSFVASLPMRNWNILIQKKKLPQNVYVASLPMRNWNYFPCFFAIKINSVLRAYLWGIETYLTLPHISLLNPLRAYLWGIETSHE